MERDGERKIEENKKTKKRIHKDRTAGGRDKDKPEKIKRGEGVDRGARIAF